jgi:TRAP-type C4-dicarboxylate transport system permease large subunit
MMSVDWVGITLLLGGFLGLMLIRVPIAFAIGLASLATALHLGASLMVICAIIAKRRNHPLGQRYPWRSGMTALADAAIGLFTIVTIIGGILTGVFAATESAAIAVVYALLVTTFWNRSLNRAAVSRIFSTTLTTLAMVTAIIMTSSVFG